MRLARPLRRDRGRAYRGNRGDDMRDPSDDELPSLLRSRRAEMVQWHLEARGIRDRRVLEAMARVPRERFVPPHLAREA